ncbi:ketosynthase chain-length factor [Streptomyces sp. NPDC020801]|uniref:ketosynthase chain-length factor n=1 Tax=unclassified Streptomyces TaxID=2593676 RepID=UPI00378E0F18
MTPAAVVTGMGVVAPTGLGASEHWARTLRGDSAIGRITHFDPQRYPSKLAGEVRGLVPEEYLPSRLLPQTDHMTRLALVAADWALVDASMDPAALPEYSMGVVTANSAGGFAFGHKELQALWSKGPEHVSAYQSFAWFYAVNTGQISIRNGLRGTSTALVTEQAGGLDALAEARRALRHGSVAMIGGAVDGSPSPWSWAATMASGRVSTRDDPRRAYVPFEPEAAGYVPGDGGALFVLESEESARARGVTSWYGRISGYGTTFDPAPDTQRPPTLRRAIELALADADLTPNAVDVVFADAAGVPELDRIEAEAIREVFGPHGVPVTAPKTMTGRLGAGGAALDLATALLALRDQVIPPTANVCGPAPEYAMDLVLAPRRSPVSTALVLARGHGGFNAAMVVTAPPERMRRTQ